MAVVVVLVVLLAGGGTTSGLHDRCAGDDDFGGSRTEPGGPKATVQQAAVKVGELPVNLAHGQEALWVTNRLGNSVS